MKLQHSQNAVPMLESPANHRFKFGTVVFEMNLQDVFQLRIRFDDFRDAKTFRILVERFTVTLLKARLQ